jgi:hypothetical protein
MDVILQVLIPLFTFLDVQPIYSSTGSLFITFTSSSDIAAWEASYEAFSNCQGTSLMVAPNGTITDGSRSQDYQNNANCTWIISPTLPGAIFVAIRLNVTSAIADSDTLTLYNGGTESWTPIETLTGNKQDLVYTSGICNNTVGSALTNFRP